MQDWRSDLPLTNTLDQRRTWAPHSAPLTRPGGTLTARAQCLPVTTDMSLTQSSCVREAKEGPGSAAKILAYFEGERKDFLRLALMITGNAGDAKQCLIKAREMALQGRNPLRGRFTEWSKWLTIEAALSSSYGAISRCEANYENLQCTHPEHLVQTSDSKLQKYHSFLLRIDTRIIIASLEALSRAVLILRTTARASILDCTQYLDVSPNTVLAANCCAMTWVRHMQQGDPKNFRTKSPVEVYT